MDGGVPAGLAASEIHGFHTTADLDIGRILDDASKRWLRPNEIYAILSNHTLLKIQPQPVANPGSGSLLLFDRNMLRNFRKDGHKWRKKKDGKTVQEAHEKLKIGNDERIHVYYARAEDDPNFYRRCYWLLDRNLERIVLVHYRQTSEDNANQQLSTAVNSMQGDFSPVASLSSNSGSNNVEVLGSTEEIHSTKDSEMDTAGHGISDGDKFTEVVNHDVTIDLIDKFDWASYLVEPQTSNLHYYQDVDVGGVRNHANNGDVGNDQTTSTSPFINLNAVSKPTAVDQGTMTMHQISVTFPDENLQSQNSFSQWDYVVDDIPGTLNFPGEHDHVSCDHDTKNVSIDDQPYGRDEAFVITDTSPSWSYADEETKVIVVGYFSETYKHLSNSNIFLVSGDACIPIEPVQLGVYRCTILLHTPGSTNFFLSIDKQTPISKIGTFEVRPPMNMPINETESIDRDFGILIRLIRLLFSPSKNLSFQSTATKGARRFLSATSSSLEKDWANLLKLVRKNERTSFSSINQQLFDLVLKNKLQEWLSLMLSEGRKTTELDSQGLGVIHLCSILDYTWAAHLFKASGLSIDFRDVYGWTALHWAAYSGRVKMVAALLSSGANPSLVTDPTPEFPGGCTAADLASNAGYEGLAAYLAEKALTAHFAALTLSGNMSNLSARAPRAQLDPENIESGSTEQEVLLRYSLAAYRSAADAADRIHSALRDRSMRLHMKAVEATSSQSDAAIIIAALKIQKAYRDHNGRKMINAAARIQGSFRTWQTRKNFLAMRRHAIKIQATFRGLLVRRQYRKLIWSVGVLEKALLRWRMKRKGLRGLQIDSEQAPPATGDLESKSVEEDFFRVSREQAEERVNRSVVRVQAMFRSHRAQQDYRKMKLAHDQAQLEYDEFTGYDVS